MKKFFEKSDTITRATWLAFFYSAFWLVLHIIYTKQGFSLEWVIPQLLTSVLIYFCFNGLFASFAYYRWAWLGQAILAIFYISPFFQLFYYQSYKSFLEQQNLSLIIREPLFLMKVIATEASFWKNLILFSSFLGFLFLNRWVLNQEKFKTEKIKPYDMIKNKWSVILLIILTALQIKWCLKHDPSQLTIRPIYPITLFALVSILYFLWKVQKQSSHKIFVFIFITLNLTQLFAFNIGFLDQRNKFTFDTQYFRSLFGAVYVQTAFGDMQQDDNAFEQFQSLPQAKLDYNILVILNDTQRWDKLSSTGYPKPTDDELNWFYEKSYHFQFPISPANFTDTAVPAILTGLSSDQDVKKIKGSLPLWDYFAKTANTFFISTQDITWSKLDKFYQSYGQKFIWSATAQKSYRGNPEDASDDLSYQFIKDYLPGLKQPWVGVWQTFASHYPYTHPPEFARYKPCFLDRSKTVEGFYNCYLNGIVYSSHIRSELLKKIDLENTVVVMTSDHGEGIGEHGIFFHGVDYHQEMVKIPFVLYIPEKLKQKIPAENLKNLEENTKKIISATDLVPTLVHLHELTTGQKLYPSLDYYTGRSLLNKWDYRVVFSSHCFPQYRCYSREIMFADDEYYVIFRPSEGFYKIYKTWEDLEQKNPIDVKDIPREKLMKLINEAAKTHKAGESMRSYYESIFDQK